VVAGPLDHRDGTGIAHRETLARNTPKIAFARNRSVKHGVANDDRFFGRNAAIGGRTDDDASSRQAFADIIIALAFKFEGDAACEPGAEALPGGSGQLDANGVVGRPV